MEENKKEEKCCEGTSCDKNKCCPMISHCMGKKHCCILKFLVLIVVLMIVFCLGVQLGKLKEAAGSCRMHQGQGMNFGYKNLKPMMQNFEITDDGSKEVKEAPAQE